MITAARPVTLADISLDAAGLDPRRAAAIYREHGCLVVRGLYLPWVERVRADAERYAAQSIALLAQAEKTAEGWVTPDQTLFLPAPAGYARQQQVMMLGMHYQSSGALFASALDAPMLDVAEAILGPDVELFGDGQVMYKEPVGGHPKKLHQDAAYFTHRFAGPVAVLNYLVDTDIGNGALHVVPGSHRLGLLPHGDTFSHLGLDEAEWPLSRAVPVIGRAGDAIFFQVNTIHGSPENHSRASRPVSIHRYRSAADYVTVSATTTGNRAEAERRAAQSRKSQQRGLLVRGFRPWSHDG